MPSSLSFVKNIGALFHSPVALSWMWRIRTEISRTHFCLPYFVIAPALFHTMMVTIYIIAFPRMLTDFKCQLFVCGLDLCCLWTRQWWKGNGTGTGCGGSTTQVTAAVDRYAKYWYYSHKMCCYSIGNNSGTLTTIIEMCEIVSVHRNWTVMSLMVDVGGWGGFSSAAYRNNDIRCRSRAVDT